MEQDSKRLRTDSFKDQMKQLNDLIEKDNEHRQSLKDMVSEMDGPIQEGLAISQRMHRIKESEISKEIIKPLYEVVVDYFLLYKQLCEVIEPTEYNKFENLWNKSVQQYLYLRLLIHYFNHDDLLDYASAKEYLGNDSHLYDYLYAVMQLVNELTRLTVNTVILNEFDRPKRISAFIKDVYQALSQLNFKNDGLRRKFDSLKYDINKVEGVIYDLTLRNLN
ncbi:hypothetical protein E3P99_02195 [Wallemia hederae]|uniref:Translin n=1 Tax=Wallemia hederae TaxID=1540922 RepID=A0A4T0FLJ3_9BASI|nr:hypothetical protein E3P99_02195 [Wallemia hederae]